MENAISIGYDGYKKVRVDFDDGESIRRAVKATRLRYIRTPALQTLSQTLGVPLVGYANADGLDINNGTACRLTGAGSIGSDMILCKTDPDGAILPLGEVELERVYTYITTGTLVEDSTKVCAFFADNRICPILPQYVGPPQVLRAAAYPRLVVLAYDLCNVDRVDAIAEVVRYEYALREAYAEKGDVFVAKDGRFALQCGMIDNNTAALVCVQMLDGACEAPNVVAFDRVKEAYGRGELVIVE